jgi:hypothetical protein
MSDTLPHLTTNMARIRTMFAAMRYWNQLRRIDAGRLLKQRAFR